MAAYFNRIFARIRLGPFKEPSYTGINRPTSNPYMPILDMANSFAQWRTAAKNTSANR
jgi:hypothetical protein